MQAKILALFLVAVAVSEAADCPTLTAKNFDIKSLSGDWYLLEETPQSWFFPNKCTKGKYGPADTTSNTVTKQWRFKWFPFSLFTLSTKYVDAPISVNQGNFTEEKQSLFKSKTTYQFLAGDSQHYAVFYSCTPHFIGKTEKVQILSNTYGDLSNDASNDIGTALQQVGIERSSLAKHDQSCWSTK